MQLILQEYIDKKQQHCKRHPNRESFLEFIPAAISVIPSKSNPFTKNFTKASKLQFPRKLQISNPPFSAKSFIKVVNFENTDCYINSQLISCTWNWSQSPTSIPILHETKSTA